VPNQPLAVCRVASHHHQPGLWHPAGPCTVGSPLRPWLAGWRRRGELEGGGVIVVVWLLLSVTNVCGGRRSNVWGSKERNGGVTLCFFYWAVFHYMIKRLQAPTHEPPLRCASVERSAALRRGRPLASPRAGPAWPVRLAPHLPALLQPPAPLSGQSLSPLLASTVQVCTHSQPKTRHACGQPPPPRHHHCVCACVPLAHSAINHARLPAPPPAVAVAP
jgi:hypothetical protein